MPEAQTIRVRLLFFARAHDLAGTSATELAIEGPLNTTQLDQELRRRFTWLEALGTYRLAVDREFATPERDVPDGAEVAIIPPVSGG